MSNGDVEYTRMIDAFLSDVQRRTEELTMIKTGMDSVKRYLEMLRTETLSHPLSHEDINGKSQRDILRLIADRNRGWLIPQAAIMLMTDAGIFTEDMNASAQVYTLLRGKEFISIAPGVYRLQDTTDDSGQPTSTIKRQDTGLTAKVASILQKQPDMSRAQMVDELLRQGWNFGGKKPINAVGMAYAGLSKKHKEEQSTNTPNRSMHLM